MATLNQIIYNIKNLVAGGIQSDDEDLSDSQMAFMINYYRSKLIAQDYDKGYTISSDDIQNLGKVELVMADAHECPNSYKCVLRTKEKLPFVIQAKTKELFTYVGLLGNSPFQRTTWNASFWQIFDRFTGKSPKWYYQNGYIYIVNPVNTLIKYINIQGVFEDPLEAVKFRTCDCPNDEQCFDGFDFDYPIDSAKIDTVVKMIAASELRLTFIKPEDTSNDTQETNLQAQRTSRKERAI